MATIEAIGILLSIDLEQESDLISISFDRNPKGLIFCIKRGNIGRESEQQEDELDLEIRKYKLSKELFIVKALSDEADISFNAKSIILVFYVTSMNYEKSLQRISKLKEYWKKSVTPIKKNNE